MAEDNKLKATAGVDTTDFKTGIAAMNRDLRVLESGFKASAAALGDWSSDATGLELRIKSLNSQMEIQAKKVDATRKEWERVKQEKGATSRAAQELEIKLNKETETLGKMDRELGKTENSLKDVSDETRKTGREQDKTTQSTGRMSLALGGLKNMASATVGALGNLARRVASLAAGLAIGAAKMASAVAVGVAVLLASTVGPASDLNETLSKSETVFASMSDSVIKNSQAAANQLGINQKNYLDYASALGAAFTAGGMGIQDATSLSEQAVKHFADIASFHNAEVEDVAASWQSAIRGSYEPIQKFFPFITDEYLKTYGTAKGLIDENTSTLSANQRAIILNAVALDTKLNPAYGDFERTSGGLANQQRILAAQVENARAKIGSGLLPVVTQLVTMLNKFLSSEAAQAGIEKIKSTLEGLGQTIAGVLASFDGKEFSLGEFIQKLFGELNLSDLVSNAIGNFNLAGMIGKLFSPDRGLNFLNFGLDIINSIIDSIISGIPNLLPAAQGILQKLVEFLTTGLPVLVQQAVPMLLALVTGILDALPLVLQAALQIILAIAQGLTQALPTLIPAIMEALVTIVTTLIENLPMLIDAALQLILALTEGLIAAIPILIPAIPIIVQAIFDALILALPMIVAAAVELIKALAFALRDNTSVVLTAIVDLIKVLFDWLMTGAPTMFQNAGKALVTGIWEGIKSNMAWLKANFVDEVMKVVTAVKGALGIHSPSDYMADQVGEHLPTGIGQGFDKRMPDLRRKMASSMRGLADVLNANVTANMAWATAGGAGGAGISSGYSFGDIIVNVPGTTATPQQIGSAVQDGLLKSLRAVGAA